MTFSLFHCGSYYSVIQYFSALLPSASACAETVWASTDPGHRDWKPISSRILQPDFVHSLSKKNINTLALSRVCSDGHYPLSKGSFLGMMSDPDDWPEEAKNEISRLEFENDALQQEVGRLVAKIISLEGEDDQITDGDLKRKFGEIGANIEDWTTAIEVEFLQQGREFRQAFHQLLDDDAELRLLHRWGLLHSSHDRAEEFGKLYWLGQLDTCLKVILSRVIWQSLHSEIFAKTYPPGTQHDAANGLHYTTVAIRHGADGRLSEGQSQENQPIYKAG